MFFYVSLEFYKITYKTGLMNKMVLVNILVLELSEKFLALRLIHFGARGFGETLGKAKMRTL